MKTRVYFVKGFIISAVVAVLFLSATLAYADTEVDYSFEVTNLDSSHRTATDLSFSAGLSEGDRGLGYWMVTYSIWTTPAIGGIPTYTPRIFNGHIWRVDVRYDGINVAYNTTITVHMTATVSPSWNWLGLWDAEWSYPDEPNDRSSAPDHENSIDNTTWPPGNEHYARYAFHNRDVNAPVTLTYLRFYEGPHRCDPCEPNYLSCIVGGGLIREVTGPIVVDANSSYEVYLYDIPNANRYIYVVGEMEYQMPGCESATSQWLFGHEEPSPSIPTVSEWGLIILAALLLAAGAVVIRRRIGAAV